MNNYTTYIFGAGASANSIPTIDGLPEAFKIIAKCISGDIKGKRLNEYKNVPDSDIQSLKSIADDIAKLEQLSADYGTIDTYFKKLYLNNEVEETRKLKQAMSFFFYLWQNPQHPFPKGMEKDILWKKIDLRYIGLLSNILIANDGFPKWNDKFRILTWNYDFQIIKAFQSLSSKNAAEIIADYSIYPLNDTSDEKLNEPNIIYLNGISGAHYFKNKVELEGKKENIYEFYKQFKEANRLELINFAWEWKKNDISKKAVEAARLVMKNTQNLVIVGYSFPYYNFEIDRDVLKSLPPEAKIYYQDYNADLDTFTRRFEFLNRENIKILNTEISLRQFYIPL